MITATNLYYTLSLHDALPICQKQMEQEFGTDSQEEVIIESSSFSSFTNHYFFPLSSHDYHRFITRKWRIQDRKSTRLNSSHLVNSYAVFCFKTKKHPSKYKIT